MPAARRRPPRSGPRRRSPSGTGRRRGRRDSQTVARAAAARRARSSRSPHSARLQRAGSVRAPAAAAERAAGAARRGRRGPGAAADRASAAAGTGAAAARHRRRSGVRRSAAPRAARGRGGRAAVLGRWRHRPSAPGRSGPGLVIASAPRFTPGPDESKPRRPGPAGAQARSDGDISGTVPRRRPGPFQRLRVLFALVVREMGTRFGRSYGGYLWAIAEPLGGISCSPSPSAWRCGRRRSAPTSRCSTPPGWCPSSCSATCPRSVAAAVNTNRGLLTIRWSPLLDTVFAKFVLNLLTMFVVAMLLFPGIILYLRARRPPRPGAVGVGLRPRGAARARHRHAQLRALRLLPDLAELLGGADPAAVHHLGDVLHLRERAAGGPGACSGTTRSSTSSALMRAGFYGTYDPNSSPSLRARRRARALRDRRLPAAPAREQADRADDPLRPSR